MWAAARAQGNLCKLRGDGDGVLESSMLSVVMKHLAPVEESVGVMPYVHCMYSKFLENGMVPPVVTLHGRPGAWTCTVLVEALACPVVMEFDFGHWPWVDNARRATVSWRGRCIASASSFAGLAAGILAANVFNPDQLMVVVQHLLVFAKHTRLRVLQAMAAQDTCPWFLRVGSELRSAVDASHVVGILHRAMARGWSFPAWPVLLPTDQDVLVQHWCNKPTFGPVAVAGALAAGLHPDRVAKFASINVPVFALGLLCGGDLERCLHAAFQFLPQTTPAVSVTVWPLWEASMYRFFLGGPLHDSVKVVKPWVQACFARWSDPREVWATVC
jgi:hypothetical protein